MPRTDKPPSQADAARAMDEINLDDLFAENDGGGGLFEGLDVDLDDMNEIMDGPPAPGEGGEGSGGGGGRPVGSPPLPSPPPPPLPSSSPRLGDDPKRGGDGPAGTDLAPSAADSAWEEGASSRAAAAVAAAAAMAAAAAASAPAATPKTRGVRKSKRSRRVPKARDDFDDEFLPTGAALDATAPSHRSKSRGGRGKKGRGGRGAGVGVGVGSDTPPGGMEVAAAAAAAAAVAATTKARGKKRRGGSATPTLTHTPPSAAPPPVSAPPHPLPPPHPARSPSPGSSSVSSLSSATGTPAGPSAAPAPPSVAVPSPSSARGAWEGGHGSGGGTHHRGRSAGGRAKAPKLPTTPGAAAAAPQSRLGSPSLQSRPAPASPTWGFTSASPPPGAGGATGGGSALPSPPPGARPHSSSPALLGGLTPGASPVAMPPPPPRGAAAGPSPVSGPKQAPPSLPTQAAGGGPGGPPPWPGPGGGGGGGGGGGRRGRGGAPELPLTSPPSGAAAASARPQSPMSSSSSSAPQRGRFGGAGAATAALPTAAHPHGGPPSQPGQTLHHYRAAAADAHPHPQGGRRGRRPSAASPDPAAAAAVSQGGGCGLASSRTVFFPYMPLPPEVALRRCHKAFPLLDRVAVQASHPHSAPSPAATEGSGGGTSGSDANGGDGGSLKEGDPLVRLFLEHGGGPPGDSAPRERGESVEGGAQERLRPPSPLLRGLGSARDLVPNLGRADLRSELHLVLGLARRQSEFLGLSLDNMRRWCRDHFDSLQFEAVYGHEDGEEEARAEVPAGAAEVKKRGGRSGTGPGAAADATQAQQADLARAPITPPGLTYIKARVRCHGFREPISATNKLGTKPGKKGGARVTLIAQLPLPADAPPTFFSSPGLAVVVAAAQRAQLAAVSAAVAEPKPDAAKAGAAPPKPSRKRRASAASASPVPEPAESVADADAVASAPAGPPGPHPLAALVPRIPYARMAPSERLRYVAAAVAIRGRSLRLDLRSRLDLRAAAARAREEEVVMALGDPAGGGGAQQQQRRPPHILNTAAMWRVLSQSHMADVAEEDVGGVLVEAWQPEVTRREAHWAGEVPAPKVRGKKRPRKERAEGDKGESSPPERRSTPLSPLPSPSPPSSSSLFDRLQSLLVEEGDTDDEEGDDDDVSGSSRGQTINNPGNSSYFVDVPERQPSPRSVRDNAFLDGSRRKEEDDEGIMDVSALSLDQRTYLQLRAVGLVDTPLVPSVEPAVVERDFDDGTTSEEFSAEEGGRGNTSEEDEDIDSVLRRMKLHLSDMHRRNNERTAFLQSAGVSYIAERKRQKLAEERDAKLIERHVQLMKRQGEKKREMEAAAAFAGRRRGEGKDEEGWIPW